LEINPSQLSGEDWDTIADQVLAAIQSVFARRRERYLGNGQPGGGQIGRDMENTLARFEGRVSRELLLGLLLQMPQGARASFDRKTHRRVLQRTNRLTYVYFAPRFIENREPEEVAADVLEHLEKAQQAIRQAWGIAEWRRLAAQNPVELGETTRIGLQQALGEARYQQVASQPLNSLPQQDVLVVVDELGRQALTGIYRQLLLNVITELWVDYLTEMEALRVSIGLEAYAQRDPLVQYKNKASDLFQELLSNMRLGVVTRMFTYRPRELGGTQTAGRAESPEVERAGELADAETMDETEPEEIAEGDGSPEADDVVYESSAAPSEPAPAGKTPPSAQSKGQGQASNSKKRRRRRH
jgi:preprotein translocase subunit SecA